MSWETRGNRRYYYRRRKINGRVVAEYVGSGPIAEICAARDGIDRHERNMAMAELHVSRKQKEIIDRQLRDFRCHVRSVVRIVLQSAGYHQHKRGEWRRRRESMANEVAKTDALATLNIPTDERVFYTAVLSVILKNAGANEKTQKVVRRDMEALCQRLGWTAAPAHEKLLIEHVCLCWLRVQFAENHLSNNTTEANYTLRKTEHFEKMLSLAHRRYLQAVECLARVRRLGVGIQINIGNQQVISH